MRILILAAILLSSCSDFKKGDIVILGDGSKDQYCVIDTRGLYVWLRNNEGAIHQADDWAALFKVDEGCTLHNHND